MKSDGLEIRPLRELTGEAMFNEVFMNDVFVPDDCVIGDINDGWRAARTTLENERVSMGSGASFGLGIEMLLGLVSVDDDVAVDQVGALLAEAQSLSILGSRMTARALSGAQPGPESSVRKLLGVEHDQRVSEVGVSLLGAASSAIDGDAASWLGGFLSNRCLTIAGGTSEVQRNVIAERLLGLPKDPDARATLRPAESRSRNAGVLGRGAREAAADQRCNACGKAHFYPRPFCPHCWEQRRRVGGSERAATLYTYSVVHRNDLPPFNERVPYVAAVVDLEEGPGCRPTSKAAPTTNSRSAWRSSSTIASRPTR